VRAKGSQKKEDAEPVTETVTSPETDLREQVEELANKPIQITPTRVKTYLGIPKYHYGKPEKKSEVGIVNGLAWTMFGGEILNIEVSTMKGTGKIQLTGKLGDVMKESAQTAHSYVRANANRFGIYSNLFATLDIHVHVPEGATPKDGPSAGVAITCGLVSALTGIPVRNNTALTGEITLRGKVLPIGGLKEKLLAAKRGCLDNVVIPEENKKDLSEIPEEITDGLNIMTRNNVIDIIPLLLENVPVPVHDEELKEKKSEDKKEELQSGPLPDFPAEEQTISHN
jgi:ATP-dependent Lon protease